MYLLSMTVSTSGMNNITYLCRVMGYQQIHKTDQRTGLTKRRHMLTANESILRAARKSDEMLEPYEWKRSCTVLRRERASNRPDLADYYPFVRFPRSTAAPPAHR